MAEISCRKSECGLCGKGCPMDVYVKDGRVVSVEGSKDLSGKNGTLCAKGAAYRQYVYNKERLLYPMKRIGAKGSGEFKRISWEEAMQIMVSRLENVRGEWGARSVIFYAGHPKWYRPALLRLSNAFGTPNYCTESSTCFQAGNMAWKSVVGGGVCAPDLKNARTVLVWGTNPHHSSTPMGRTLEKCRERGTNLIVVDPKNTIAADHADLHLKLRPATDGALALGMAHVMIEEELYDREFVEKYTYGFEEYRDYIKSFTPERAGELTGVDAELIRQAARIYAIQKPSALMSSTTIVHNVNGFQALRAVLSLMILTGNYDCEGGNLAAPGPSVPCPEFGGIVRFHEEKAVGEDAFPAWFDLAEGLNMKACQEAQCSRLADYIIEENPYPLKALIGFGVNHHMWPEPERMQEALQKLDFYVDVDLFLTDSAKMADLVLPAASTLEIEKLVTGGPGFSLTEPAIEPLGEARNDIEIIIDLFRRLGLCDGVLEKGYDSYLDHILAPSGLTLQELRRHPEGMTAKNIIPPERKCYEKRPLSTPSGKAEFKSLVLERYRESHGYDGLPVYYGAEEFADVNREDYPILVSTGSRKPQLLHARMYRIPWIAGIEKATLIEMDPSDAEKYGIEEGGEVTVTSPAGSMDGYAHITLGGMPGWIQIYHGNKNGDANRLIARDYVDPYSGFPGFKGYFCRIEKRG